MAPFGTTNLPDHRTIREETPVPGSGVSETALWSGLSSFLTFQIQSRRRKAFCLMGKVACRVKPSSFAQGFALSEDGSRGVESFSNVLQ